METAPAPGNRLQQLHHMLEKTPNDPFLLYGIAMEHKKAGEMPRAIEFFDRTIQADPGYCYAYYQKGQTLESSGNETGAKDAYRAGIDAATKKGDSHARGEIEAALELLG